MYQSPNYSWITRVCYRVQGYKISCILQLIILFQGIAKWVTVKEESFFFLTNNYIISGYSGVGDGQYAEREQRNATENHATSERERSSKLPPLMEVKYINHLLLEKNSLYKESVEGPANDTQTTFSHD